MNKIVALVLALIMLLSGAGNSIMLEAHAKNWDVVSDEEDYHASSFYQLTYQGDLSYHENYHKTGKRNERRTRISPEDLQTIRKLLENQVQTEVNYDAVDGTGWKFTFYDEDGEEIYSYHGYIYDTHKEEIIELLEQYLGAD